MAVKKLQVLLNAEGHHRDLSPSEKAQIQSEVDRKVAEYVRVYKDK